MLPNRSSLEIFLETNLNLHVYQSGSKITKNNILPKVANGIPFWSSLSDARENYHSDINNSLFSPLLFDTFSVCKKSFYSTPGKLKLK